MGSFIRLELLKLSDKKTSYMKSFNYRRISVCKSRSKIENACKDFTLVY